MKSDNLDSYVDEYLKFKITNVESNGSRASSEHRIAAVSEAVT